MGGASSKSKTLFLENFRKLLTQDLSPSEHAFWDELWKTTLTIEDLFEIISPDHVRKLIAERPKNLNTLFTQAVAQLYQVVETPYPVYFPQALNCARVLARFLPFMLENENKLMTDLFWKRQNMIRSSGGNEMNEQQPQQQQQQHLLPENSAGEHSADMKEGNSSTTESSSSSSSVEATLSIQITTKTDSSHSNNAIEYSDSLKSPTTASSSSSSYIMNGESEPLAVILINALFHLLFLPDFTIADPNQEFTEKDVMSVEFRAALMWAPGVGSREKAIVHSTEFDTNRIDVLRLMLTCFCDSLYQSPDQYDNCASYWLEVATSADAPYAEIVFYSLMNTVLGYDPIGWGVPYGNIVSTDTAKLLTEAAVQVLITLLDYGHSIRPHSNGNGNGNSNNSGNLLLDDGNNNINNNDTDTDPSMIPYVDIHATESRGFNVFRRLLFTIDDHSSLNFMFRGFSRLLNNVHESKSSYLPYSVTRIETEQELLVLLWKCLGEVPQFMNFILKHCDVTELLLPICYLLLSGRKDVSKTGMMYLCTFCLLKFSGERSFGVALNKPYQMHLPVDVPLFSGTYADLLVIVLHKMIVSGSDKLSSLYHCFLTTICNVSPYCKGLCSVAAVKIVNLFQLFTSPRFLYQAEGNHAYVSLLLETMNNIIQYQYEGNVALVYAIVKRKELFEKLAHLNLPKAILEASSHHATDPHSLLQQAQQQPAQQQHQESSSSTSTHQQSGNRKTATSATTNTKSSDKKQSPTANNKTSNSNTVSAFKQQQQPQSTVSVTDMPKVSTSQVIVGDDNNATDNDGGTNDDDKVADTVIAAISSSINDNGDQQSVVTTAAAADASSNSDSDSDAPQSTADVTIISADVNSTGADHSDTITTTTTSINNTNADKNDDNDNHNDNDNTSNNSNTQPQQPSIINTSTTIPTTSSPPPSSTHTHSTSTNNSTHTSQQQQQQQPHLHHRFIPSKEWLNAVKSELPLLTIMRLLKHLVPQIEDMAHPQGSNNKNHKSSTTTAAVAVTEQQVMEFIKRTTMVGLLPVPHPIVIRKYQPNRYTSLWFTAFQWGVIFMHNQESIPLFDGRSIKLFSVQSAPSSSSSSAD